MFFVLYALLALSIAVFIYIVVGFVLVMTMDTGPDWLHAVMIPGGILLYVVVMFFITDAYSGWVNTL